MSHDTFYDYNLGYNNMSYNKSYNIKHTIFR